MTTCVYENTYWCNKGEHQETNEALRKFIPMSGEVDNAENNPLLEQFRLASNCYYDLYNNGLCNRADEFREIFGFDGPEYGDDLTKEIVDQVEAALNRIIISAAKEQNIAV